MDTRFRWDSWDFDFNGDAYIIAKRVCPEKEDVPDFIIDEDRINSECLGEMVVEEGICKFMVRNDWDGCDGPHGGYYIIHGTSDTHGRRGWFPVWIVRKGDWY